MRNIFYIVFFVFVFGDAFSQGILRQRYQDQDKKNLKEIYQVKDTIRNILHGRYVSYYLNGNIESKGQFTNNETSGVWEFYYETGNLKMRGILFKGANYGMWEYFYESGQKNMEGIIYGKNREGEWKTYFENGQLKEVGSYNKGKREGLWRNYFEDGVLKGEIDYEGDFGTYTEYYHTGKILGTGPKAGNRNAGYWRFFAEDGTLQSEGEYDAGKKSGAWQTYFPSGKIQSRGHYAQDDQIGTWEYFFENGQLRAAGVFEEGKKSGVWKITSAEGTLTEIKYDATGGDYREYYASGKLKVKGRLVNEKKEGKWEYYFEDGKREGECEFVNGKGTYFGYFPNGNLQTKGTLEDDLKTGTWEIYEMDGKLSGYYRPFYDNRKLSSEIVTLAGKSNTRKSTSKGKRVTYFVPRVNEFRGVIVGGNPVLMFAGRFPFGVEFYSQARLGHEFEFVAIRDPFFQADANVPNGKQFERGYNIAIKQKLYNPLKAGLWYFGHEFRFTNIGHFTNVATMPNPDNVFTASAAEQRFEWGVLLGYRIMKKNNSKGFTIDAFISGDIGYRSFDVDPFYASYFDSINQSPFSTSIHAGFNLGNIFSFR
ncbi:MAG: toxin-antitoxin system YwqK family antitoxin [Cyclobacteriaceae bacterium]|nr:toxin-antitoxin system YwqK family antitoxin [Cyclobacteriaceae bacterium]